LSTVVYSVGMTRSRKKTHSTPIDLVDATYDDVIDEFCKRFDLPPVAVARVLLSIDDQMRRTAIPAVTGPYAFPRILRKIWRKLGHNNWVFLLLDFRSKPKL